MGSPFKSLPQTPLDVSTSPVMVAGRFSVPPGIWSQFTSTVQVRFDELLAASEIVGSAQPSAASAGDVTRTSTNGASPDVAVMVNVTG